LSQLTRTLINLLGRDPSPAELDYFRSMAPTVKRCLPGALAHEPKGACGLAFVDEGWLIRYAEAPAGRQILDVLLPGDVIGIDELLTRTPGAKVQAVTAATLVRIPRRKADAAVTPDSPFLCTLARQQAVQARRSDGLVASLGRRSAAERMAYFLVELHGRLMDRGLARPNWAPFPLRRPQLADLLGLSPTHVTRTMAELSGAKLAAVGGGYLTILDPAGLERLAGLGRQDAAVT
jgi:CRP-like cAMP-binding protein